MVSTLGLDAVIVLPLREMSRKNRGTDTTRGNVFYRIAVKLALF